MANQSIYAAFERMWQHLTLKLGSKVDKEDGKVLSSNDFTNEYKTKLDQYNPDSVITQETDPTVPAWAKSPNKPTYTATEVGALPDTTNIPNINNIADGSAHGSVRTILTSDIIGYGAHAEGYSTIASGDYSHTEGGNTTASGESSHAEGDYTIASGRASYAGGSKTTASGSYSHAEGYSTTASGAHSHAEGYSRNKAFDFITAESTQEEIIAAWNDNKFTLASGQGSHVEGSDNIASGSASHAEGTYTIASGYYSHAEGSHTIASGICQHVQGQYNIEDTENKYIHIVGNGSDKLDPSNAHALDFSGNAWFAGDVYVGSTSGKNKDEGSKKLATEAYVNTQIQAYIDEAILGGAW